MDELIQRIIAGLVAKQAQESGRDSTTLRDIPADAIRDLLGGPERDRGFREFMESPIVTDTLNPLMGGPVDTRQSLLLDLEQGFATPGLQGRAFRPGIFREDPRVRVRSDMSGRQLRNTLVHEAGHVLDFRDLFPGLEEEVKAGFGKVDKKNTFAKDETEYFAEVFDRGLHFLQQTVETDPEDALGRLERSDSINPGTRTMVEHLISSPLFETHPLRAVLGN